MRSHTFTVLAVVALFGLLLIGCGGAAPAPATTAPTAAPPPPTSAPAAKGGIAVVLTGP